MGLFDNLNEAGSFSKASGADAPYVVLQVTLKEKFLGTGSGNLTELEDVINKQAAKGYRLHTISTANGAVKVLEAETEYRQRWYSKDCNHQVF